MAVLLTPPYLSFFDSNGSPLSGGKVYTYEAGTSTPKASYTDAGAGTANANPVILDSSGRASIWIDGSYRIVITDSDDNIIDTIDNIEAFSPGTRQEDDATPTSGTVTLNMNLGNYRKITAGGNFTLEVTPPPSSPGFYVLELVNGGAYTITWDGIDLWFGGSAPAALTASGTDFLGIIANNSGTVLGYVMGLNAS